MNNDKELQALLSTVRETHLAVELLDINDRTIDRIEGELVSGSLSINGDSPIRRVGDFSAIVTDNNNKISQTFNQYSLNKRVKIAIGIRDLTRNNSEIVWFNQGIFIMVGANIEISDSVHILNIQVNDKMVLHDGTVSGTFTAPTRLDVINTDSESAKLPEHGNSMREMLIGYAQKFAEKEVELEEQKEFKSTLLEYMELIPTSNALDRMERYRDIERQLVEYNSRKSGANVNSKEDMGKDIRKSILSFVNEGVQFQKLFLDEIIYHVATKIAGESGDKVVINDIPRKIQMPVTYEGEPAFILADFVFPDNLSVKEGDTALGIYDACNDLLGGTFEYFYDVDGNFIFQEKPENTKRKPMYNRELQDSARWRNYDGIPIQFDFEEHNIINSFNNKPDWSDVKNDITLWGDDKEGTVGLRLIIENEKIEVPNYVNYISKKGKINRKLKWQEYLVFNYMYGQREYEFIGIVESLDSIDVNNYLKGVSFKKPPILIESGNEFSVIVLKDGVWQRDDTIKEEDVSPETADMLPNYYSEIASFWMPERWNVNKKELIENPEEPKYDIEIIRGDSILSKFSTETIGRRKTAVRYDSIKDLFPTRIGTKLIYSDDRDLNYVDFPEESVKLDSQKEIMNKVKHYGGVRPNLFDMARDMILDKTSMKETLDINALPLYNLEVNRRVRIRYERADVSGNYIVKKINFNFEPGSLMTVNLVRTREREGYTTSDRERIGIVVEHQYSSNGKVFKITENFSGFEREVYQIEKKEINGYKLLNEEDLTGYFDIENSRVVLSYVK